MKVVVGDMFIELEDRLVDSTILFKECVGDELATEVTKYSKRVWCEYNKGPGATEFKIEFVADIPEKHYTFLKLKYSGMR